MRPLLLAALVVAFVPALGAQTVPARGADDTFEVASWNLLQFGLSGAGPSDEALQQSNVAAVIRQSEVDVWALQEGGTAEAFSALAAAVAEAGYQAYLGPDAGSSPRLAYLVDPSVVSVERVRTVPGVSGSNFGGRVPYELVVDVTLGGAGRRLHVIDVHAKAFGTASDRDTRERGAVALKAYTDGLLASGAEVVVLGDLNDYLTGSTAGGGLDSPYTNYVLDGQDYGGAYVLATLDIDRRRRPTYCSNTACTSGSTLDHVLFSAGLAGSYVDEFDDRYAEVLTAIPSYRTTTSDHIPVVSRFAFGAVATDADPEAGPVALLAPVPNPFFADARLRFRLDAPSDVRLDVFDVTGRRVASLAGAFGAGAHAVPLDGRALAPGTYVVRLSAAGTVRTRLLVRAE